MWPIRRPGRKPAFNELAPTGTSKSSQNDTRKKFGGNGNKANASIILAQNTLRLLEDEHDG